MGKHPYRLFLAAAAAAVCALVLAACGSSSDSTTSSPDEWGTSSPAASGSIDSVSWNLPYGEPFTLDYIQALSPSDSTVLANLCESLLRLGPDMTYEPGLAESWDTPDETTVVFDLRPGLKFSNGDPVTTDDVIFSLERNLDPKLGSFWAPWFENVKSIDATGKNQVTVNLSKPDVLFEQFMATAAGAVVEKSYVEEKGSEYGNSEGGVMCAGPYELSDWTPGKSITMTANPNYWDSDNAPKAKQIDFSFVTNNQTAADALKTGEIDGTFEAPLSSWPTLTSSDSGNGYLGKTLAWAGLDFSQKAGPIQNVHFRRALLLSLDKEGIASSIYHGTAQPVRSGFFPSTWGYGESVYKEAYDQLPDVQPDLEQAKAELAKVPDLQPIQLLSNADDEAAKQLAAYIQSEAKKVGIEIELKELPAPQYVSAAFDQEQFNTYDMGLSLSAYLDVPEPVEAGVLSLTSGGVFNSSGYDNAAVDKWVSQARATADPDKRAALMVKVQEQVYEKDVVSIPLINWATRVYMNSEISGVTTSLTPIFYSPWATGLGATG
ncbi:MAG: ABC transporter substrate-binding protein [Solirubrobacterales bacterium]